MSNNITSLQNVTNCYGLEIIFTNSESDGNNRRIAAFSQLGVGNAWIPWCDCQAAFDAHHMSLTSIDSRLNYAFWQSGSYIYYTNNGLWSDSPNVLDSDTGHGIVLIVWRDGTLRTAYYAG